MAKKKTAWPFQEGFIINGTAETHVFTTTRVSQYGRFH